MASVSKEEFRHRVQQIMSLNWHEELGYTSPNGNTYPHCWLWDSCFHSLIWNKLGDYKKARRELLSVFRWQQSDGFVPHMGYQLKPSEATEIWRQPGYSNITQPPMYGHAIRTLHDNGIPVSDLVQKAEAGFDFLLKYRCGDDGMLFILHPSEAGCGSSPRWDSWSRDSFSPEKWQKRKSEFVQALECTSSGSSISSSLFKVESASFNALTAFNMLELYSVTNDSYLQDSARLIVNGLDQIWNNELETWIDVTSERRLSSSVRTIEALLGVLCTFNKSRAMHIFDKLMDPSNFASPYGLAGVDKHEPSFNPAGYWRGAGWPQLNYLFWIAAARCGRKDLANELAEKARQAAVTSNFSEYFNSLTGEGLGASPQSWACLPICMPLVPDIEE